MNTTSEHAIRTILVGQSGGPTAAINASLAGVVRAAHAQGLRVLGMRNGIQGFLEGDVVDLVEALGLTASESGSSNHASTNPGEKNLQLLRKTPSSWLGSCRFKLPELEMELESNSVVCSSRDSTAIPPIYQQIDAQLKKYQIDAVLYIGGNDSMDTTDKLSRYFAQVESHVRVVGVPKTIDNDLEGTDHAPGFGSSARYIATIVRELARDSEVYGKPNITIVETMGRDAGWLGAASALAREKNEEAPDFILLPEVAYDEDRLLRMTAELFERKNSVVIVISEGVRRPDGSTLLDKSHMKMDAFGHLVDQSGNALYLAELFQKHFDAKIRGINLNSLQRCAMHSSSKTDLSEAFELGKAGVDALLAHKTGCMIGLQRLSDVPYQAEIRCIPISEIANRVKSVPAEMISEDGLWVTEKALAYLRPLISNEELAFDVDTRRFVSSNILPDNNGLPPFIPKLG